jgi:hypothetical protein
MTMKNVMKKVFRPRVMTCALLFLASKGALATCSFMDGRFGPDDSVALSFGTVVVQRDTPVGTVVASTTNSALGGRNNFLQCNASGFTTRWAVGPGFAPVVYNGQTLYQSGVPGLAFRIVTSGAGTTAGRYGTGPLPRQISNTACVTGSGWWRLCGGTWGNLGLQLVKIAPTTGSGPMTGGSIVQALVVGDTNIIDYTTASGVGVQVMYNNAPLALNSRIAVATTAADGTYAIPLKARYYQMQPAVTPGTANANATFTLTYQ